MWMISLLVGSISLGAAQQDMLFEQSLSLDTVADKCLGDWVRSNHFTRGEKPIGNVQSAAECSERAFKQCPNHDLANVQHGGKGSCWCQKSHGKIIFDHEDSNAAFDTCQIRETKNKPDPKPQPEPEPVFEDGCLGNWTSTNYFTDGEKNLGPVSSQEECVDRVKDECPHHDIANLPRNALNSCWCQKSWGERVKDHHQQNSIFKSCRVRELKPKTKPEPKPEPKPTPKPVDPAKQDGCLGGWVKGNHFTRDERNLGPVSSRKQCVDMVLDQCPGYDIANVPTKDLGSCWCQKSFGEHVKDHPQSKSSFKSCRVRPFGPPAHVPKKTCKDGCKGEWVPSNYFEKGQRNLGAFASRKACVDKVRELCPDHDLANVPNTGEINTCWCQKSLGKHVSHHKQNGAKYDTCRV